MAGFWPLPLPARSLAGAPTPAEGPQLEFAVALRRLILTKIAVTSALACRSIYVI